VDVQDAAALITALGGGTFVVAIVTGIFKWASGASGRERVRNSNLLKRSREAENERDEADEKRREAEEHVSILKRQLLENGIEPKERISNNSK